MNGRLTARGLALAALGIACLGPLSPVSAEDVRELIAPYLRARDGRSVGEVVGQAHADGTGPSAPPVPYTDVSVLLLAYSPGFGAELDYVKEHYRDSLKSYMGAVADVSAARIAHENALLWAGGGELIRGEVSDVRGGVRLAGVPAGEWILLAWRQEAHRGKATRPNPLAGGVPGKAGYSVVTFWRMRLQVVAGATMDVSLSDRNVWLTGIREDLAVVEGAMSGKRPKRHR